MPPLHVVAGGFAAGSFAVDGGDAEEAEALVCKTSLNGFESRRHLQLPYSHLRCKHDGV